MAQRTAHPHRPGRRRRGDGAGGGGGAVRLRRSGRVFEARRGGRVKAGAGDQNQRGFWFPAPVRSPFAPPRRASKTRPDLRMRSYSFVTFVFSSSEMLVSSPFGLVKRTDGHDEVVLLHPLGGDAGRQVGDARGTCPSAVAVPLPRADPHRLRRCGSGRRASATASRSTSAGSSRRVGSTIFSAGGAHVPSSATSAWPRRGPARSGRCGPARGCRRAASAR